MCEEQGGLTKCVVQEEIADKLGVHRCVVCRDLKWIRDSICPGESPDVPEAYFVQVERMMFNPGPGQFDPRHPPLEKSMSPEEAAASWKDKKIYDPMVDGATEMFTFPAEVEYNPRGARRARPHADCAKKSTQRWQLFSPKGWDKSAQGNALGTEVSRGFQALKGRYKTSFGTKVVAPFQGW